jgi:hypothetical protein
MSTVNPPDALTEEEVREEIELFAETNSEPILTEQDLRILLRKAKMADYLDRHPGDPNWRGTWNIAKAVYLAWLVKQSRLVAETSYSSGGRTFNCEQFYRHCGEMAELWKKRMGGVTVRMGGSWRRRLIFGGNFPGVETNATQEDDGYFP